MIYIEAFLIIVGLVIASTTTVFSIAVLIFGKKEVFKGLWWHQ
jgi:hypothetical protein